MTGQTFYKLSGGGNDFIALVEPDDEPRREWIRALCRRGVSLGADGLFTLTRTDDGVRMRYWNADGRAADLCLNGARCAARLAFELGSARDTVDILTEVGRIQAHAAGRHGVALDAPPLEAEPEHMRVRVASGEFGGWRLVVGVPHFVLFDDRDLAAAPVLELGPELRHAPEFGTAGTNVDFVSCPSRELLQIRSYERGVEAETLACGTGILASVAVAVAEEKLRLPARVATHGGFVFEVAGDVVDRRILSWRLTGDARLVASGELHAGAEIAVS